MGWYTTAICEIDFCKETYSTIEEVDSELDRCKDYISSLEKKIILYTMSSPKTIVTIDKFSTLTEACDYVQEVLDDLGSIQRKMLKLELLKKHFGLRGGDYVRNVDLKKNFKEFVRENVLPEIEYQREQEVEYNKRKNK